MTRAALPADYAKSAGVVLTDCSTYSDWTHTGTAPADWVSVDSVNVRNGTNSIAFAQNSFPASRRYETLTNQSWDLSSYQTVYLSVYVPYTSRLLAQVDAVNFRLSNDVDMASNSIVASLSLGMVSPGWNLIPFSRADFSAGAGSFSWSSAVQSLQFEMKGAASGTYQSITLDAVLVGVRSRPKVMLTMDDGHETQYTAFGLTDARDIPMTLFIIPQFIDEFPYLTSAQLAEMYAAGCSVGVHDGARWDNVADIAGQIGAMKAALLAMGYTRGNNVAAWPEGEYGFTENNVAACLSAISSVGIVWARAASTQRGLLLMPSQYSTLAAQTGIYLYSGVTLATAKERIAKAVLDGVSVVITGHKIDTAADSLTWATSDFTALLDTLVMYRSQGLIDIVTVDQWYDGLRGTRAAA